MARKRSKKNKLFDNIPISGIVIFAIFIVLILVIASFTTSSKKPEKDYSSSKENNLEVSYSDEDIKDVQKNNELEKLKSMGERNRIEYYTSKFLKEIENGNYDEAYEMLNIQFRRTYFKSEADFEAYVQKTFSKMMSVDYTNIERNGDVYVLWCTITDAINGTKDSGVEFNFVVKENNFNEFELSFSVI